MGAEATCTARFKGRDAVGKARLETEALQFRGGDVRLSIPFKKISSVTTRAGVLTVNFSEGTASFDLGPEAERWAHKIQHPPSRLKKLGAKADWRVSIVAIDDQSFTDEIAAAVAELSIGRVAGKRDAIFLGLTKASDLARISKLKRSLKPDGALWTVRPKGHPDVSERAVMAAAKAAGLVDVKVVAFSSTHTAEKFVIPIAKRPRETA
jgi:hypothetical protein